MLETKACVIGAGFPASARVRSKREYAEVFASRHRLGHRLLVLHWLPTSSSATTARLGLAVSRKVDPRAVGRNRIKRVLRDHFRRHRAGIAPGLYVVVARSAAAAADNAGLRAALRQLLQRAGALPPIDRPGTMPAPGVSSSCADHP